MALSGLDLTRVKEYLPGFDDDDDAVLQNIVDAVAAFIQRYLGRDLNSQNYDQLYNGTGYNTLILDQFPVLSVKAVRGQPFPVLTVRYTDTSVAAATVQVTSTGLVLSYISNGTTTSQTLTYVANTTISALNTAINLLSNWTSTVATQYGGFASSELAPSGTPMQGSLNALASAQLLVHAYYLNFSVRNDTGELYSPSGFARGFNNYRVQFTAGYATLPEDLIQACAELVAAVYNGRSVNPNLQSESLGQYSYTIAAKRSFDTLSAVSRKTIEAYRNQKIVRFQ